MNGWKAAYVLLIAIACTTFVIVFFTADSIQDKGMMILLGMSILACLGIAKVKNKRSVQNELHRQRMEWLDWMNHRRHEWLNELQVLYGYIKLNRPQSLLPRLDDLHETFQQESIAARLDHPELVWHLYRLISLNQKFEVEIEKEEGFLLGKLGKNKDFFATSMMQMIDLIEENADFDERDQSQSLTIHLDIHEDRLCCRLYYEGSYDPHRLDSLVYTTKSKLIKKKPDLNIIHKMEDGYAFCEMSLPFRPQELVNDVRR